jgi:hypothetical protein
MTVGTTTTFTQITILLWVFTVAVGATSSVSLAAEMKVPLSFSGGHEIGKNDHGRPVVLIAAALEVKPEVFREAFGGVTPARGRGPSGDEARKNKAALMKVLAPHGVTNERLDQVSDYYRYQPQRGQLWPTSAAKAYAFVENGKVTRIVVADPGSGYCSPPVVHVDGFQNLRLEATLEFSKDVKKNGSIAAVELTSAKKPGTARSAP